MNAFWIIFIIVLAIFISLSYPVLKWWDKRQLNKLRRKYDDEGDKSRNPDTNSKGFNPKGARELAVSNPGEQLADRVIERDDKFERRSLLQDEPVEVAGKDVPSTRDEPGDDEGVPKPPVQEKRRPGRPKGFKWIKKKKETEDIKQTG